MTKQQWHPTQKDLDAIASHSTESLKKRITMNDLRKTLDFDSNIMGLLSHCLGVVAEDHNLSEEDIQKILNNADKDEMWKVYDEFYEKAGFTVEAFHRMSVLNGNAMAEAMGCATEGLGEEEDAE